LLCGGTLITRRGVAIGLGKEYPESTKIKVAVPKTEVFKQFYSTCKRRK
jgi:hypothetical protein